MPTSSSLSQRLAYLAERIDRAERDRAVGMAEILSLLSDAVSLRTPLLAHHTAHDVVRAASACEERAMKLYSRRRTAERRCDHLRFARNS